VRYEPKRVDVWIIVGKIAMFCFVSDSAVFSS